MKTVKFFSYFAISLVLGLSNTASAEGIATMFPVDAIEFAENNVPELMDNTMVLLDDEGQAVCSIPFGLDTSEDMIADDIKPCSEEDLLSLTMTMPLKEGEVAAFPLIPIAVWGGTAIAGCVIGYIGAGTPEAQPPIANNSEEELQVQESADSQVNLMPLTIGASVGFGADIANDALREQRLLHMARERARLQNGPHVVRSMYRLSRRWRNRTFIDMLLASRLRMTITGTLFAGACYGARTFWR